MSVGEFKARFSRVLEEVIEGRTIAVQYGRKKAIVAWLAPADPNRGKRRPLGILEGKASFKAKRGLKLSGRELLEG
jgi:antitoxin (DNA-binding transcriptional repressor) of toxin-antitoxin stability system